MIARLVDRILYGRDQVAYQFTKRRDAVIRTLVWRLPSKIVYWALVRVWAHGTTANYGTTVASELTVFEAARRWQSPLGGDNRRARELLRQGWTLPQIPPVEEEVVTVTFDTEAFRRAVREEQE